MGHIVGLSEYEHEATRTRPLACDATQTEQGKGFSHERKKIKKEKGNKEKIKGSLRGKVGVHSNDKFIKRIPDFAPKDPLSHKFKEWIAAPLKKVLQQAIRSL